MRPRWILALVVALSPLACDDEGSGKADDASAKEPKGEDAEGGEDPAQAKAEDAIEKVVPNAVGKAADTRDFGVESAKITFQYTGLEEGTVTAYVDGYGATVALHRQITKPMPQEQYSVWKDAETKMWKPGETPTTMKLRTRESELRLISTQDPDQLKMAGYERKPNEKVAGKDCEVWHSPKQDVTVWRWKGIDLKYHNGSLDKVKQAVEATEVVTPAEIPPQVLGE